MDVNEKIKEIILSIKEDIVETNNFEGKDLFEDLEFDSIQIMELVVNIEEEFKIDFDEEELVEVIGKYDDLYELVNKKVNTREL